MRKILLSALSVLIAGAAFTQNPKKDRCGTSQWLKAMQKVHPDLLQQTQANEIKLSQALEEKKAKSLYLKQNATYTLPVVFHIVGPNPSAITDAQVLAQLNVLNNDWQGLNADTTQILPQFKSLLGKGNISFCLAQRTPNNLPTSGIVRVVSNVQSDVDVGDPVKYTSKGGSDQWDPTKYINIWICIIDPSTSILGYGTFPTGTPFPQSEQGVVIDYQTLPGGVAPYNLGRTLTHEMGHYFYLLHPWDPNGCSGSDFPGTTAYDDTPAQADETYDCPTGTVPTKCNPADPNGRNYQVFMDYPNDACMHMFTKGQMQRAELALTSIRGTLTTSNGCVPPVSFSNNASVVAILNPSGLTSLCSSSAIGSIQLLNAGNNTLNSLVINIQVNGGTVSTVNWNGTLAPFSSTTVSLPAIVFPLTTNTLTIYSTKPNGVNDAVPSNDTARATITIAPRVSVPYLQGFESPVFPPPGWDRTQSPVDGITWQRTTAASKSGQASAYVNNFNYGNFSGRKDDLVTPIFNFGTVDSIFIKFDVAAALYNDPAAPQPPDTLEVAVTMDCGATYQVVYKKYGTDLATNGLAHTEDEYFPANSKEWRTDSVNITSIVGTSGEFRVRIRNIENWGNNVFIDNFQVYTKILPARLKSEGVLITPNPVYGTLLVQHLLPPVDLQGISIFNSAGQLVYRQQYFRTAQTYIPINTAGFAAGMYSIRLDYADKTINQKFIKF